MPAYRGGEPQILQQDFSRGMRRDYSRDQIGANAMWASYDFIPNRLTSPLEKRGGWSYAGSSFSGSPSQVRALLDAPMNGGHYLLAVTRTGQVYRTNGNNPGAWNIDGTTANVGAILQNPLFFVDTAIFPSVDGTATLYRGNENTIVAYTDCGITHKPTYLTQWKSRMVGASGEFIVFGPPIGTTGTVVGVAWDETSKYGVSQPVKGLREMRGSVLIFYEGFMQRIRGTTPAGYGATTPDIIIEDLFAGVGLVDAFTLAEWNDMIVWADKRGVYYTDGAAPVDVTEHAGLKEYFTNIMSGWTSTWRVCGGVFDNLYILTIYETSTNTEVKTFVFDLPLRIGYHFSNCPFTCFARNPKGFNETYVGIGNTNGRGGKLSTILSPSSATESDADGGAVLPYFETPYYRYGAGPHRLVDGYLGYEMTNSGTTPTLTVTHTVRPDRDGSYTSYAGDQTNVLDATNLHGAADQGYRYKKFSVREEGPGIAFKIAQSVRSTATRIYNISGTLSPLSGVRSY